MHSRLIGPTAAAIVKPSTKPRTSSVGSMGCVSMHNETPSASCRGCPLEIGGRRPCGRGASGRAGPRGLLLRRGGGGCGRAECIGRRVRRLRAAAVNAWVSCRHGWPHDAAPGPATPPRSSPRPQPAAPSRWPRSIRPRSRTAKRASPSTAARPAPASASSSRSGGPVMADGAMGTMLFQNGLQFGDPPEVWNLTQPEIIRRIQRGYLDAGSQIIMTNTFGGNRLRLALHGLSARVDELNRTAAILARAEVRAAGDTRPRRRRHRPERRDRGARSARSTTRSPSTSSASRRHRSSPAASTSSGSRRCPTSTRSRPPSRASARRLPASPSSRR